MPSASWFNGWLSGDVVTATEFRKGMGCVFDSTLSVAAASIDTNTVGALPTSFAHMLAIVYARDDTATAGNQAGLLRFNNDSAANYDRQNAIASAASQTDTEGLAATSLVYDYTGGGGGANLFGASAIFIPNYANTSNNKVAFLLSGSKYGTSSGNLLTSLRAGFWRSNSAITRVSIAPASSNLAAGSRLSVYVMGS